MSELPWEHPAPEDGPGPMEWDEYERRSCEDYEALLDQDGGEREMQAFFERNPAFVPSAFPIFDGSLGGHGAFPDALITQPPLQGLGKRIPDFMWLTRNSAFFQPVLVEIEDPAKRWFVGKGQPSAELTEALDHFREWREWFNSAGNQQVFLDTYQVPLLFRSRSFRPLYVLVFGRVEQGRQEIAKLRAAHQRQDQFLCTYDHLSPEWKSRNYLCVRNTRGRYVVVAIPPTARLRPNHPDFWRVVHGRKEALEADSSIAAERKKYLLGRLELWDEWAARDGRRKVKVSS
jgi:hypothetical protein